MPPSTLAKIDSDSTDLSLLLPPKIEPPEVVYFSAKRLCPRRTRHARPAKEKLSAAAFHEFRAVQLSWDDLLQFTQATTGGSEPRRPAQRSGRDAQTMRRPRPPYPLPPTVPQLRRGCTCTVECIGSCIGRGALVSDLAPLGAGIL